MTDAGNDFNDGASGSWGPGPSAAPPPPPPPRRCSAALLLSVVCSAVALSAVGALSAMLCPILTELQAERVRAEDGTEVRILGFWGILVLSMFAGWTCWIFSWTLTCLDSDTPGSAFPKPLTQSYSRRASEPPFHLGHGVAALNGIMAVLVVAWGLS